MPRVLVDVSKIDMSTTLFGQRIDWPYFCSPTALQRLFHHEGEGATARAAHASGTIFSLSSISSTNIEDAAKLTPGPKVFQVYMFKDRSLSREFVQRAKASGYVALQLTVDVTVSGNRERDIVTGMTVPPKLALMSLLDIAMKPKWVYKHLTTPKIEVANVAHRPPPGSEKLGGIIQYLNAQIDRSVTWKDAEWMIKEWGGPFAIKGVMTAADAKRAADIGATAVMVSQPRRPAARLLAGAFRRARGDRARRRRPPRGDSRRRRAPRHAHLESARARRARVLRGRPHLYGLGAGGELGVNAGARHPEDRARARHGARRCREPARHRFELDPARRRRAMSGGFGRRSQAQREARRDSARGRRGRSRADGRTSSRPRSRSASGSATRGPTAAVPRKTSRSRCALRATTPISPSASCSPKASSIRARRSQGVVPRGEPDANGLFNSVRVDLAPGVKVDFKRLERHFYTSSSCGICGKASLDSVAVQGRFDLHATPFRIDAGALGRLPAALSSVQEVFEQTGGLHASGLFDSTGTIVAVREDVGRHNALDKLIGDALMHDRVPLTDFGIVVSGRASFELMQKAKMAGCALVAAVGAPSSLAVELAVQFGITLVGFLKARRFNVYSRPDRIL